MHMKYLNRSRDISEEWPDTCVGKRYEHLETEVTGHLFHANKHIESKPKNFSFNFGD